jgi:hypothetical protein
MHPLLADPTDEQACLLQVIYEGRQQAGWPNYKRVHRQGVERVGKPSLWPTFQYVESELYRHQKLDARTVLATCPHAPGAGGAYGWVWHGAPSPQVLQLESRLTLTVAGMTHVLDASDEVDVFIDMLSLMVARERAFVPLAATVEEVTLSAGEVRAILEQVANEWSLDEVALDALRDALDREPATWHTHTTSSTAEQRWVLVLSPFLRDYADVTTPQEYLERMVDVSASAEPEPEPLYPSALSLPEAIDYLNAVWRLHARRPLMRIGRAEAAAKLVLECASVEEFESRVSSLCSILDSLDVPEGDGHKLIDLAAYLQAQLPAESSARAGEAIDDLRALLDIRVWRQHTGTDERAARGMRRLGISLPVYDWGDAWLRVQARAVAALSVLREEVERLDPS